MEIVNKDDRIMTNISPINFETDGVVFYEMKITGNFAGDLLDMVKGDMRFVHDNTKKVPFGNSREVYDMDGNYFVVEYIAEEEIHSDIDGISNNFSHDEKGIFSEKILEDKYERQIPEYLGKFEYDGKFYLIVNGLNKLTGEINPEKGIYKGVILSPDNYYKASKKINSINSITGKTVDQIVK